MFGKSRTEKSASKRSARAIGAGEGSAPQPPVNRAEHGGVEGHPAAFAARLTEEEREKLLAENSWRARVLRINRLIAGLIVVSLVSSGLQIAGQAWLAHEGLANLFTGTANTPGILSLVYFVVTTLNLVGLSMLIHFDRKDEVFVARMITRALVVLLIGGLLLCVVINGVIPFEITYLFQFLCAVAYQVYNDPFLDRSPKFTNPFKEGRAVRAKMYSLEPDKRNYIPLNFFNLFWIFMVASVAGLAVEMVFCLLVNGVWADRAGLLWGPFSPIYGFGAVLMTIALNRVWYRNAIPVFVIAGIIGAAFEFFVSWYMEVAFGVCAWDYSGTFLSLQGRTDFAHFLAWGALGLVWMRLVLPSLMSLVDMLQVHWRAFLTVAALAFMLVNATMTVLALDCWSQRQAGLPVQTELQQFYAKNFPDEFMQTRFSTMSMSQESALKAQQNLPKNSSSDELL